MAKRKAKPAPTRVSPLKPGLSGARNWATAQARAASYSPKRMRRLILTGLGLAFLVLWGALWLGGFIPALQASSAQFSKHRLMNIGFVVKHVDVVGEGRIAETEVRDILGVRPGDYLFDMNINNAQMRVQSLNWVDTAVVRRLWPDRIVVHINEKIPYAMWQNNGVMKVVDQAGVIITGAKAEKFPKLPLVVGIGASAQTSGFLDILDGYEKLRNQTEAIVYISQRRWDIVLKNNGPRILLPADNPHEALERLDVYQRKYGVLDLQVESIDMRVNGRLSLRPLLKGQGKRA